MTYSGEADTDETAIVNLIQLYNTFLKQSIFNCRLSGYGSDPSDGSTDAGGVTCSFSNKLETFKCRLQYRYGNMFNKVAGAGTLTF